MSRGVRVSIIVGTFVQWFVRESTWCLSCTLKCALTIFISKFQFQNQMRTRQCSIQQFLYLVTCYRSLSLNVD